MQRLGRGGYTLMELITTILIIGVLAAFAVPNYIGTVETNKYDDAVGLTNQIGMTNRMFALDHAGSYSTGQFMGANCACAAGTCAGYGAGPFPACALVCCNYLGDQPWSTKPYNFYACDPGTGGGGGGCAGGLVSASQRNGGIAPYSGWGVNMSNAGTMNGTGGAPSPTY